MHKTKKIRIPLLLLCCILLLVLGYVGYVFVSYSRLPDHLPLTVSGSETLSNVQTGTAYRVVSYNVGFGAYSADYSFFMDGGKESRARSADAVETNLGGAAGVIISKEPSFILLQEVDVDGTRSMHINERDLMVEKLNADTLCSWTFAQNYDSAYLFYPILKPHGANQSGIMTVSQFNITSAERRSLPIESGVTKLVDLDRCYSVNRFAIDGSDKEFVLYNVHLSAYTSDGTIAIEQLKMLCADMKAEYEKGNYCVAGGDFNKDLLGNAGDVFGVAAPEGSNWAQPIPDGIIPTELTKVVPFDAEKPAASCRTASEPYNPETSFVITVDGFIVSANVEVIESNVIDTGYAYSDHNPVYLDFILH